MTEPTQSAPASSTPQTPRAIPELPDEEFWIRYSPHHEFPLSTVTSVALHALGFGLLLLGVVFYLNHSEAQHRPLNIQPMHLVQGGEGEGTGAPLTGGGRGIPGGQPNGPPNGSNPPPPEDVQGRGNTSKPVKPESNPMPSLPAAENPRESFDGPLFEQNPEVKALIDRGNEAARQTAQLDKRIRALLKGAMTPAPAPQRGEGGPGKNGGPGNGDGPGKGNLTLREKRLLRWVVHFPHTKHDFGPYVHQLQYLGAYIGVPDPENPSQILLYKDLSHLPLQGATNDLKGLDRIYWHDEDPQSVRGLAAALGIRPTPNMIFAFFPKEFEEKLVRLEESWRGKTEDQIDMTVFRLVEVAPGRWEPQVVEQRLKH